jgi:hypothetical protein
LLLRSLRVEGRRSRGYIEKNCRRNRTWAFLDEKLAGPRLGFSMMGQTRKTAFRSVCGLVACTVSGLRYSIGEAGVAWNAARGAVDLIGSAHFHELAERERERERERVAPDRER